MTDLFKNGQESCQNTRFVMCEGICLITSEIGLLLLPGQDLAPFLQKCVRILQKIGHNSTKTNSSTITINLISLNASY